MRIGRPKTGNQTSLEWLHWVFIAERLRGVRDRRASCGSQPCVGDGLSLVHFPQLVPTRVLCPCRDGGRQRSHPSHPPGTAVGVLPRELCCDPGGRRVHQRGVRRAQSAEFANNLKYESACGCTTRRHLLFTSWLVSFSPSFICVCTNLIWDIPCAKLYTPQSPMP